MTGARGEISKLVDAVGCSLQCCSEPRSFCGPFHTRRGFYSDLFSRSCIEVTERAFFRPFGKADGIMGCDLSFSAVGGRGGVLFGAGFGDLSCPRLYQLSHNALTQESQTPVSGGQQPLLISIQSSASSGLGNHVFGLVSQSVTQIKRLSAGTHQQADRVALQVFGLRSQD